MEIPLDLFRIGFFEFRLTDLIDVAIVAFVLYRLYALLRGTIAAQIFIGLILIIGVSFISQLLEMRLLSRVLQTLSDIWVIALIIIFQPELRRILLLLGRRGFSSDQIKYDVSATVDVIVDTAQELSTRRFGALIVISRATNLSLSVETGVPINAALSREMLLSIFNPRSPLHDGAAVIAGDRIESARVVLPFSSELRPADNALGTRHRAGLGISEQADVFVVIVSEETGNISYALGGELYYDRSLNEVRKVLRATLQEDAEAREHGFFRRLLHLLRPIERRDDRRST